MSEEKEPVEMQMYRSAFRKMLETESVRIINNDSTSHAIILIEELLRAAHHEVYVYCTQLDEAVWCRPEIIEALRAALLRGVVFHAMTKNDVQESNSARKLLEGSSADVKWSIASKVEENFMVVDGKAFRVEQNTIDRRGFACANSPINALALVSIYQKILSSAA